MTAHPYGGLLGEIADLLAALEGDHHLAGWDNMPPTLYRVHRHNGRLQVQGARLGLMGIHPRDELRALADAADEPQLAAFMESSSTSPPLAHLLIMEAWMRVYEAGVDEAQVDADARRRFADLPGSFESRQGTAMVGKRFITLCRKRNEPPFFGDLQFANAVDKKASMGISLRDLHQRIARHWRQPVGL